MTDGAYRCRPAQAHPTFREALGVWFKIGC